MNILIIDNYDSFTYNLYQMIGELLNHEKKHGRINSFSITVKRNNEVTLEEIVVAQPDRIIISPGPGTPSDPHYFGICADVIDKLGKTIPVLGVCLGMQGIAHVFGGKITKANKPMHGKTSVIAHSATKLFKEIPRDLEVMRYHSLIVETQSLPECFEVTATIEDGEDNEIMAIEHKEFPLYGIQFHPESFATEGGSDIIKNFIFI